MHYPFEDTLLITDMDGTLFNSQKEISPENLNAITAFVKNGGKFCVATGRTPLTARPWLLQLPINAPCIFHNGCMIKDLQTDKVLQCQYLDSTGLYAQIEWILKESPTTVVEIFTPEGLFIVSDPRYKDPYLEQEHTPHTLTSLEQMQNYSWIKILLCDTPQAPPKIDNHLAQTIGNGPYNHFYSHNIFYEITPLHVSKGNALSYLHTLPGLETCKVIAIGDHENDIELLQEADIGIAVENAAPKTKTAASYIVADNDHHAVKEVLETFCHV